MLQLTVLKYLTPTEEAYILLEGKDFDGLEQSQITNSVFLPLAVMPGTKVLKPVAKVTKTATRYFASIGGELLELVAEKGIAKFTRNSIKVLTGLATKNRKARKIMLGKYNVPGTLSYIKRAGTEYKYFDMEDWLNISYLVNNNADEIFRVNKQFIDDALSKGNTIYLSHDPFSPLIRDGYYKMELDYIENVLKGRIKKIDIDLWFIEF